MIKAGDAGGYKRLSGFALLLTVERVSMPKMSLYMKTLGRSIMTTQGFCADGVNRRPRFLAHDL